MATKAANIEGVGAGVTSATFTTTKEWAKDASLEIKIRVKAADGPVDEWLILPYIKESIVGQTSMIYPISVFKGDKIILQKVCPSFNQSFEGVYSLLPGLGWGSFNKDTIKIKNSAQIAVGEICKIVNCAGDMTDAYQKNLKEELGKNSETNPELHFQKIELWLKFYDEAHNNETISRQLSATFASTSGWSNLGNPYAPVYMFDYHGDMTRDEAITAGIKILDGNTDPNV